MAELTVIITQNWRAKFTEFTGSAKTRAPAMAINLLK